MSDRVERLVAEIRRVRLAAEEIDQRLTNLTAELRERRAFRIGVLCMVGFALLGGALGTLCSSL